MKIIHGKLFVPYLNAAAINKKVKLLANQINKDYAEKKPIFIAILNGSFIFAADLFREIKLNATISFIKLKSYQGSSSTGNVLNIIGLDESLNGRPVLLLEDIIDTGKTLHDFLPELKKSQPSSIKIVTLLLKPQSLKYPIHSDYTGFEIPDKFVVGYGMDYEGLGRNLPDIYQMES